MANDFLVFAQGGSANVESQAAYSADANRTDGNQPGVASSSFNNKALRQANAVTSQVAQSVSDLMGVDTLDDATPAKLLQQIKATLQRLQPVITSYLSGSGNHNLSYYFFIATGSATAGATYTNNSVTFTVAATVASGTLIRMTGNGAPLAAGTLTKSAGTGDTTLTFYAVRSPVFLYSEGIGGGGGGAGSGTSGATGGSTGVATSFGTTLLVGSPGVGGASGTAAGGSGGAGSLGTGPEGEAGSGGDGGSAWSSNTSGTTAGVGGVGGTGIFGGAGYGGVGSAGAAGKTNSGAGGGGGGLAGTNNAACGAGGGAGGFFKAYIKTVLSTYAYVVGTGGAAGGAGTSGFAGAAGAAGRIMVVEYFQ
jgi:hypothetical protein